MQIQPVAVPTGPALLDLLPRLEAALAGGAPIRPYPAGGPPPPPSTHEAPEVPDDLALVVGTSGSTGRPKLAMLTAAALTASAEATHARLGGAGHWLLAMPAHHIAGIQVLLRAVAAGTTPTLVDVDDGFTSEAFAVATRSLIAPGRRYTALVPTQVLRLLEDPAGTEALRSFDAVLVGGAAVAPAVRARAADAGVRLTATYGMSETAGGCVYDGVPLAGTRVRIDAEGRIHLGGATVAHGYLGDPALTKAAFGTDADGIRWFRTDDSGELDPDGRLHVIGRLDDLVNTGGLKVAPRLVEEALVEHVPGVREAVVVGTPHPRWGEAVSALLVLAPGTDAPDLPTVRDALRAHLPAHALPQRVAVADAVPLRGPGKPDRRAVAALLGMGE